MGGTIPIGDGHVGIPNGQRQLLEVRHRREGISGKGKEWSAGCAGDKRSLKSQRTVAWPQETIESSVRCERYTCEHEGEVHAEHGNNSQMVKRDVYSFKDRTHENGLEMRSNE